MEDYLLLEAARANPATPHQFRHTGAIGGCDRW